MATSENSLPTHELLDLPWIAQVRETNRPDAQFRVSTRRSIIRMDHELHEIENMGYAVESMSTGGDPIGATLYVDEK